jgi:hypothetical protein
MARDELGGWKQCTCMRNNWGKTIGSLPAGLVLAE